MHIITRKHSSREDTQGIRFKRNLTHVECVPNIEDQMQKQASKSSDQILAAKSLIETIEANCTMNKKTLQDVNDDDDVDH